MDGLVKNMIGISQNSQQKKEKESLGDRDLDDLSLHLYSAPQSPMVLINCGPLDL